MNTLGWRALLRWGALGFLLTVALGWPSDSVRARVSELVCTSVSPLLEAATFGVGGHARLLPQPSDATQEAGANPSSDSALLLTIDGYRGRRPIGMSVRRDFYLPWCVVVAATATAPLSLRRRLLALALGLSLVSLFCLAALWTTCMWLFARLPAGRALSESTRVLLDTVVGSLIMPPGIHLFVPVLVALFAWRMLRDAHGLGT